MPKSPEEWLKELNAIFRKGKCFYVFGCISKKFPKNIFWYLENATRKRQNQKNKHSTHFDARRSTGFNGAVLRELQSDDCVVDHDQREGEMAIVCAILRSVDRDLAKHCVDRDQRKGKFAIDGASACERHRLKLGACEQRGLVMLLPLVLSLSLSLSGIHLR